MINILDDVAILTSIPTQILKKIETDTILCISEGVNESLLEGNNRTEFDIGYGTLIIIYEDDQLKYKFIPSAKLTDTIVKAIKGSESPLTKAVNEALVNRLTSLYKDLL